MNLSDIIAKGFLLVGALLIILLVYTFVINSVNARSSYEYGVELGEKFCGDHNGELEKIPKYLFRTAPNVEPHYIECKEIHDSKIEYNRYELVKGNYYLVTK